MKENRHFGVITIAAALGLLVRPDIISNTPRHLLQTIGNANALRIHCHNTKLFGITFGNSNL